MRKTILIFLLAAGLSAGRADAQNTPIKNLAPTGDTGPLVAAIEAARLYPVFILPMGQEGYYDFELKASVTNWSGGSLVYWTASAVDSAPANPAWDAAPLVYFTLATTGNGSALDGRVWHAKLPGYSLFGLLGEPASSPFNQIVVVPAKIPGSAAWMYQGNPHLLWSYCRLTAFGKEVDSRGNAVWNPVVPTAWRAAPPTP